MYRYKWHKIYDLHCHEYKIECFASFNEWKCFYEADPSCWLFLSLVDCDDKIYGIIPYYYTNHHKAYYIKFLTASDYYKFQKFYKEIQKERKIKQDEENFEQNLKNLSALAENINNKLYNIKISNNEDISEKNIYNAIKNKIEKNGWCIRQ